MKTERQVRQRLSKLRSRMKAAGKACAVKGKSPLFGVMLAQAAEEQLLWVLGRKR